MTKQPLLEVNLGEPNGSLVFFSLQELQEFHEEEQSAWAWLSRPPVNGNLNAPWNHIVPQLTQIRNNLANVNDGDMTRISTVKTAIVHAFVNNRLPLSNSPIGRFVLDLKEEEPIVAAAALATWMNCGGVTISNFEHFKGATLMAAFDANITSKVPAAVKRSLHTLQEQYQGDLAKNKATDLAQREDQKTQQSRQIRATARMIFQGRKRIKAFSEANRDEVEEAIKSIRQTEDLYREHMRLKSPVEYWTSKAGAHKNAARKYRNVLMWFSVVAGGALVVALSFLAHRTVEIASNNKPAAIYLTLVTIGIVLSTMVFWAARILTRLFLSEHHLAIDADERAVMAQTYLALTAEGQATSDERSIVLGSLFRPTADGIVKDDAAPDISPASLLSRLGAK